MVGIASLCRRVGARAPDSACHSPFANFAHGKFIDSRRGRMNQWMRYNGGCPQIYAEVGNINCWLVGRRVALNFFLRLETNGYYKDSVVEK